MSSTRSTPSPRTVLPPIIANEKDRRFLVNLNARIDEELNKIDKDNHEQRYIVYKDAFDKIIDYVIAYKPLLTAIKAEYEDCIETIQRGQREAFYLSGKLKAIATEPSTIHNYRKRADDLEQKLHVVALDNEQLHEQVTRLREARLEKERKAKEVNKPPRKETKRDNRSIPGLTLQQSTDKKVLAKELEKYDKQLKELTLSYKTRYSPNDIRDALKDQLAAKVSLRDQLQEQTSIQKQKRHRLKIAVEAAQAYMKIQPPHQSIGEAVANALTRSRDQIAEKTPADEVVAPAASNTFEEDDPTREKEAELMLEYIEKFNELVEDHKLEEAAIHAANSPKGILRTPETLHRFSDMRDVTSLNRSPLLAFCDALMATVPAYGHRPTDYLSLECVKCALNENRLDLITHWLSQNRLALSKELGDAIFEFCDSRSHLTQLCMSLAQKVYVVIKAHVPSMICMLKQGRTGQTLEYAQKVQLCWEDCAVVVSSCPSSQLAQGMYETRVGTKRLMPMGKIANTLLTTGDTSLAVQFVRFVHQMGEEDPDHNLSPLRNAVFEDDVTPEMEWHGIVKACQDAGYHDSSIDILAAVTVIMAVRKAAHYVEEMERQQREQEMQKQLEEEAKKKKEKKRRRKRYHDKEDLVSEGILMKVTNESEEEMSEVTAKDQEED